MNQTYLDLLDVGPFPERVDPWAEEPRAFHPLHSSMVEIMLGDLHRSLLHQAHIGSISISRQMVDGLYIGTRLPGDPLRLNCAEIMPWELPGSVTIIEIISPTLKSEDRFIHQYLARRHKMLARGKNVVEIDITRSTKRLTPGTSSAYNVTIYRPNGECAIFEMQPEQVLTQIDIPILNGNIAIDLQSIYRRAYATNMIGYCLHRAGHYTEDHLPFLSLFTAEQRHKAMQAVETWQRELERLREK